MIFDPGGCRWLHCERRSGCCSGHAESPSAEAWQLQHNRHALARAQCSTCRLPPLLASKASKLPAAVVHPFVLFHFTLSLLARNCLQLHAAVQSSAGEWRSSALGCESHRYTQAAPAKSHKPFCWLIWPHNKKRSIAQGTPFVPCRRHQRSDGGCQRALAARP